MSDGRTAQVAVLVVILYHGGGIDDASATRRAVRHIGVEPVIAHKVIFNRIGAKIAEVQVHSGEAGDIGCIRVGAVALAVEVLPGQLSRQLGSGNIAAGARVNGDRALGSHLVPPAELPAEQSLRRCTAHALRRVDDHISVDDHLAIVVDDVALKVAAFVTLHLIGN